jgi:hypothetical protein
MIARNEVSLISLELERHGMLKRLRDFFRDVSRNCPIDDVNHRNGRIRVAKKKPTNVKSKKKTRTLKQDDPAYGNRAVAEEEDDENEMVVDDEVDEVGMEKEDKDEEDDF